MSDEAQLDVEHSHPILAKDSQVGETYRSRTNLPVIVREKRGDRVVVRSLMTGHDVAIPMDYPLNLTDEEI